MSLIKPIYWKEGIFLQPQHFQYNDLYHSSTYSKLFSLTRSSPYGVLKLEIIAERLSAGFLECRHFEAILPGGICVHLQENAVLPARQIKEIAQQNGILTIAVGLPKLLPGNAAVAQGGIDGTFEIPNEHASLPNLYDDAPALEINQLWYRCRFLIGDEIDAAKDMHILTIARLIVENGTASLDRNFVPACLNLGGSKLLFEKIRSIDEYLNTYARGLEGLATPWRMNHELLDSEALKHRLVLAEINQAITQIEHRMEENLNPSWIFEVLLVMLTRLSALTGLQLPRLPAWNHDDPLRAFVQVTDMMHALLDQLRSGPDSVANFHVKTGWLEALVPKATQVGDFVVYLVVQDLSEQEFDKLGVPKLASLMRIETVVSRALPGVKMERVSRIPYGLGDGTDHFIWRIDTTDELWFEANANGVVCLHWLDLPVKCKVKLVFFRTNSS